MKVITRRRPLLHFMVPRADLRPWNALVAPQSSAQSMHSSMPSTRISFPDTAPFGNSDQLPANSGSSTTNIPLLGLPLLREPGAIPYNLAIHNALKWAQNRKPGNPDSFPCGRIWGERYSRHRNTT